jgi:hypothetical protein
VGEPRVLILNYRKIRTDTVSAAPGRAPIGHFGYIYRDAAKRYYPGARALFPATVFHPLNMLRRVVSEELLSLRKRFGLAAAFVIFMGGERWVMEAIHGNDFLSPYSETVVSASMHAVSGKILLSTLSNSARTALIGIIFFTAVSNPVGMQLGDSIGDCGKILEKTTGGGPPRHLQWRCSALQKT